MRIRGQLAAEAKRVKGRWGSGTVVAARGYALNLWRQEFLRELIEETPLGRSGFLRKAWRGRPTPKGMIVENVATYARNVEEGTGIYGPAGRKIVPVFAKALRWHGTAAPSAFRVGPARARAFTSSVIFARSVKGMRARRMFARTLEENPPRERFPVIMLDQLKAALRGDAMGRAPGRG